MSNNDTYRDERARRKKSIDDLINGNIDIVAAIEQFNKLDETYKTEEQGLRERLECIYKETRHHTANWPIVYSAAQTGKYPLFNGNTDDDCNPYYRISEVMAGNNDGIAPQFAEITRTGGPTINRHRTYEVEAPFRSTARTALVAYPDRSSEGLGNGTGGSCSNPQYTDEASCIAAPSGETWTPGYVNTAPELLEAALTPWRAKLVQLKTDLCGADTAIDQELQDIIGAVDLVLSELPPPPIYPNETLDPAHCSNPFFTDQASCELAGATWDSTLRDAIDQVISYIDNEMVNTFDQRATDLTAEAETVEKKMFAIIGLRLHQINGSYAKIKQVKDQYQTNLGLIEDHKQSISNLNILIVKDVD